LISNNIIEGEMTEYPAKRDAARCPPHPGAMLADAADINGLTKVELAARLSISRQHVYDLMRERKPVSPSVAVKLGAFFGNGGGIWLRMQTAHDLWIAERDTDISTIRKLEAA
jgi:addiction module HigA family antidote